MPNIKVLIVEDEPLIAADISMILGDIDYEIAGIAYDSTTALDYLAVRHPDLVLLDIAIQGDKDGIDIAKIINEKYKLPFIFITSFSDKVTVDRAKYTLPYGYIVKPFKEKDIFSTIEMALFRFAAENRNPFPTLEIVNTVSLQRVTEKEYEVLQLVGKGLTNKQIAEKLYISVNTVKSHLKKLLTKLDAPNRSTAIAKVRNAG